MDRYRIQINLEGRDNLSDELRNVNRQMDDLQHSSSRSQRAAGGLSGGLSSLAGAAKFAGGAFAIMGGLDIASNLNAIGSEAGATEAIFKQLVGSQAEYVNTLSALRTVTGGVVDDMSLMAGASQLLRMNLAETNDEAVSLVDMALKLKKPTESASEAIENFSLMLANQSVARLDSFGISSAAVRTEIEQLIETGQAANREEAFKLAVMNQGADAIERLGDAATVGQTSLAKLQTKIGNFSQDFGVFVNGIVEGAAEAVVALTELGTHPVFTDLQVQAGETLQSGFASTFTAITGEMNQFITDNEPLFIHMADRIASSIEDNDVFARIASVGPRALLENRGLRDSMRIAESDINDFLQTVAGASQNAYGDIQFADVIPARSDAEAMGIVITAIEGYTRAQREATYTSRQLAEQTTLVSDSFEGYAAVSGMTADAVYELQRLSSNEYERMIDLTGVVDEFWQIASGNQMTASGLMSRDGADAVRDAAAEVQSLYESFETSAEGSEFVTDAEVERMRLMADNAADVALQADAAATRFENMSLDALLGAGSGGRGGELLDLVLGNLSGDARDSASRAGSLAVGRETDASLLIEEEIAPLVARIFEEVGTEAGTTALTRVNEAIDAGTLAGLDADTMRTLLEQAAGYRIDGSAGGSFMVNPGDTPFGVAQRTGMSVDEVLSATGASSPYAMPTGEFGAGGGLLPIEDTQLLSDLMGSASDSASNIKTSVEETSFEPLIEPVTKVTEEVGILDETLAGLATNTYSTKLNVELIFADPTGSALGNSNAFQNALMVALRQKGVELVQ